VGLQLSVLPTPVTNLSQTLCQGDSVFFNGAYLTDEGVYTAVLPTHQGCDSTIIFTLTVNNVDNGVVLQGNTLTATAQNAQYVWLNCTTGLPVQGASGQSFTPTVSGLYAVLVTQNGCPRLSDCVNVIVVSTTAPADFTDATLAPNPAVSELFVRFDAGVQRDVHLELTDAAGRLLARETVAQGAVYHRLDLAQAPEGVLFVRLFDGVHAKTYRIVKASR
jgi:hypothetical protein